MSVSGAFSTYLSGSHVMKSSLQVPLTEFPQRETLHLFVRHSKALINDTASIFPSGAPMDRDARLQSLFYITEPSVKEIPSRFPSQNAHRERCPVSRTLLQLSLKSSR